MEFEGVHTNQQNAYDFLLVIHFLTPLSNEKKRIIKHPGEERILTIYLAICTVHKTGV